MTIMCVNTLCLSKLISILVCTTHIYIGNKVADGFDRLFLMAASMFEPDAL